MYFAQNRGNPLTNRNFFPTIITSPQLRNKQKIIGNMAKKRISTDRNLPERESP